MKCCMKIARIPRIYFSLQQKYPLHFSIGAISHIGGACYRSGWKSAVNMTGWSNFIINSCNKSNTDEVQQCFEENTFTLNETMLGAVYNLENKVDLLHNNSEVTWNTTASNVFYGRCYTFLYSKPILANQLTDGLAFGLNPNITYKVILHDPNFYLIVSNPLVFPGIWREFIVIFLNGNLLMLFMLFILQSGSGKMEQGKFEWLYITVVRHKLYQNNEDRPCEVRRV